MKMGRRILFFFLGSLGGGLLGLIIPPLTARGLLFLGRAYNWLFFFYFNPFCWMLLGGFLTLCVRSLRARLLWAGLFLVVGIVGSYPSSFFVWATGVPYNVEYKEIGQASKPVSIGGAPFQLTGRRRVVNYNQGDGGNRKELGSTYRLVSGKKVLREWKDSENTLGLLFPAEDSRRLIVVLEGFQRTRIFRVDPAMEQAEELRDFIL